MHSNPLLLLQLPGVSMGIRYFSCLGFIFSSAVTPPSRETEGARIAEPMGAIDGKREVAGLEALGPFIFPVSGKTS